MTLPDDFQKYADDTELLFDQREVLTFREEIKRFNSFVAAYERLHYLVDTDDADIIDNYRPIFTS